MTPQLAIQTVSEALIAAFWICAPLLLMVFILGIAVNLIQIATSLQDQVFSTVPRLIACLGGFLFLMPWMLHHATAYAIAVMGNLTKYAH